MASPAAPSLFNRDPEVKLEHAWLGRQSRPSVRFLERDHASAVIRAETGERTHLEMDTYETALAQIQDARRYPDLQHLCSHFLGWRLYHLVRTDRDSPLLLSRADHCHLAI